MKKVKRMLSAALVCMLLVLSVSVPTVSADVAPVFQLDMSAFDATAENGTSRGLTDSIGTANSISLFCPYRPGYGSPAIRLQKDSFANLGSGTTEYITMYWSRAWDGKTDRRLAVTLPELADKSLTAEFWMRYKDVQWSSLLSIRPENATANVQSVYMNAVGTKTTVQLRANGSNDNTQYLADNDSWHHVVLQRELTEADGQMTTTAKLYVDGVYMGSNAATSAPLSETAAVVYAGAYESSQYCPSELSVASLKVYDGLLDADTVSSHYVAEQANFTEAKGPEVLSTSPADGGEVNADAAVIGLTFDIPVDGATLANGLVLRDSLGRTVDMDNLELSADGLSAVISASNLKKDEVYTVYVTEALCGAAAYGGLPAAASSFSFTAKTKDGWTEQIIPSDFGWTVGEEHPHQDLEAVSPYLNGDYGSSGRVGTFYVEEDGGLVFKHVGGGQNYDGSLTFLLKEEVGYGLFELTTGVKGKFVQGGALLFTGSKGASVKPIEHSYTFGTADYLPLRLEAYAKTAADDWKFTVYNDETNAVLATATGKRATFGDLKIVRFYTFNGNTDPLNLTFSSPITMQYNPRGVQGGQAITGDAAVVAPDADNMTISFARVVKASTIQNAWIENASGKKIDATLTLDADGKQLHISFGEYLTPEGRYILRFGNGDCADYIFTAAARSVSAESVCRVGNDVCATVGELPTGVSAVWVMAVVRDANGRPTAIKSETATGAGTVTVDVSSMSGTIEVYCWEVCTTHLRAACAPVSLG